MKKLILVVSFITGLSVLAHAQITKKSPDQRAGHLTKVLQKKLNLTADQATQVNTIFFNQANRMDSLKSNPSADKKDNQLAVRSIRLATQKQVLSVLNDEQKQQFVAWEKMRKEKHKEKKGSTELKS
ncbi:hypothetical protein [Mucilaginibacter sp.]|uniref:hypothetical protein n=1 Tax=Mucilaginibacter sp. TaxID=1882438 RepID=UPI003D1150DD